MISLKLDLGKNILSQSGLVKILLFLNLVSALSISNCANQVHNNPEDPGSSSYLPNQLFKCLMTPGCLAGQKFNFGYTGSPFVFSQHIKIDEIKPSPTGNFSNCTASPSLPTGLTLDPATCVISGTPSIIRSNTEYEVNAAHSSGSLSAKISLEVTTLGAYAIGLLKTGQTACFNATTSVTCGNASFPRQDGDLLLHLAKSYTDPGDGTIFDNITGLLWQKCSEGGSGGSCAGATSQSYAVSSALCSAKGFRLPTIFELASIVDVSVSSPSILSAYFPGTGTSGYYWSSTPSQANAGSYYMVSFLLGALNDQAPAGSNYVRCVSGTLREPSGGYTDNGDGTILDKTTKLTWQKCSYGQGVTDCTPAATAPTWANALIYCRDLNLTGRTWRLPNRNELLSIMDYTKSGSSRLHETYFPNPFTYYWSGTTRQDTTTSAHAIVTTTGFYDQYTKTNTGSGSARCVSGP
ncbi:DUF1566 domain-containing protein [Leptospira ilyithenensis]|uniref:DUF1566 domain-containing protein n=1 Tax=Leptospira ilyithenensis TaxID=2484901 RepID=A0A4R9LP02_9LEPT|nr:DUF1566 domain-containing protein [Leptospira ilyithenensis]TGN09107.1 DUF1566 domain-containing protein [Leptospira ilyithenensis]